MKEVLMELLDMLHSLNRRVDGLESDEEGRGYAEASQMRKDIDILRERLKTL